jgi:fumarate hydratase class II
VVGNEAAVALAGSLGVLELNVMLPVMARNLMESSALLSSVSSLLADRCVAGIEADAKRCEELIEKSLSIITPLSLRIGYNRSAELAHEAYRSGKTIRELLTEKGELSREEIDDVLDPRKMT